MKWLRITVDGKPLEVAAGTTVAAALLSADLIAIRHSVQFSRPRGIYCGMGVCFECLLTIDGEKNLRACLAVVKEGMVVETGR